MRAVRAVLPMSMVERGILERREGSERESRAVGSDAAAKHRLRCGARRDVSQELVFT